MQNKAQFQRFQRKRQVYMSPRPRAIEESPQSIKFKSHQGYSSVCGSFRGSPSVGSLDANSERSNDFSPKVENRIADLQRMLENEKMKRQQQYNQLLGMVSGFKGSSKEIHSAKIVPNFEYGELQFPMTPRVKERKVYNNYQKQTEKIKRSQKSKVEDQHFYENKDESFDNEANKSYSIVHTPLIPGIEILLQQINRQCDKHSTSILKIQEQMFAMRLEMSKTKHLLLPKVQQVPVEIKKFIRDQCKSMKNSLNVELKDLILDLIGNTNLGNCQQKRKCEMNQVYCKLANISEFFAAQVKEQQQITSKQILQMKQEIQLQINNKFESFSHNILQQTSKVSVQICNDLTKQIHTEKSRIDQIQQENKVIFQAFEKTIQNMQQNLYRIRNEGHIYERIKREVIAFVENETRITNQQNQQKTNLINEDLFQQIKNLQGRIERIEDEKGSLPSFSQVVKQGSFHTQETDSQLKSPQSMEQSEVLDYSFDGTGRIQTFTQQTPLTQKQKEEVLEMIGQNIGFLECRSCTIEESVGQVIQVLNGLVEKLNKLM